MKQNEFAIQQGNALMNRIEMQFLLVPDGNWSGMPLERSGYSQYGTPPAPPSAMETVVIVALCMFCAIILADVVWTIVRLHKLHVRETTTSGTYFQAAAEDIIVMPTAQHDAVTMMTPPPSVPELTKTRATGEKIKTPKSPWRRLSSGLSFFKRPSPLSAAEV